MTWLDSVLARARQWKYPRAFRIETPGRAAVPEAMCLVMSLARTEFTRGAKRRADETSQAEEQAADAGGGDGGNDRAGDLDRTSPVHPGGDGRPTGMEADLAIALCNTCFRLQRNAAQLAQVKPGDERAAAREVKAIQRAVESVVNLLQEHGVEFRDLTGQPAPLGREDFSSIGRPEEVPDLDQRRVLRVERPAVFVGGQLVQVARGVIGKPPAQPCPDSAASAVAQTPPAAPNDAAGKTPSPAPAPPDAQPGEQPPADDQEEIPRG